MPQRQRAKQFAPYDALSGFDLALRQVERRMCLVEKRQLADDEQERINRQLSRLHKGSRVRVTYFDQGEYKEVSGPVEDISGPFGFLVIQGRSISFSDVYHVFSQDADFPVSGEDGFCAAENSCSFSDSFWEECEVIPLPERTDIDPGPESADIAC